MSAALIRAGLEGKLKTWATSASVAVQWQNVVLSPEPAAYVRSFVLPADTLAPDVERLGRTYRGIYQITLVRPIGEGPGAAEAWAAALSAAFAPAIKITSGAVKITITQPLSVAQPINEPARFAVPCSIPYTATVY